MSTQLDILALEPFYGGARRSMLEVLIRCSRHRWTLLKLPARRFERRLTAAAQWFAEQFSRHGVGKVDLVYASEALNLADLTRLVPDLSDKPKVAYFHENQLFARGEGGISHELVNLSTATAASEIWFNSLYHLKSFLLQASALVEEHPELRRRNPMSDIAGKSHVVPPPVDFGALHELFAVEKTRRERRRILVETREADLKLLVAGLETLGRRGEEYHVVSIGPDRLPAHIPHVVVAETNFAEQIRAILSSRVFISCKPMAMQDLTAVRAMAGGCWPVLPATSVYEELIPKSLHPACLYELSPDLLASRIQDAWRLSRPQGYESDFQQSLRPFDSITACKLIDQRLEELAILHAVT